MSFIDKLVVNFYIVNFLITLITRMFYMKWLLLILFSIQAFIEVSAQDVRGVLELKPNQFLQCDNESCKKKFKKIIQYAHNGNPTAQVLVATFYLTGEGLEQDASKSAKWFRKAVRNGSTKALWVLSNLYSKGLGVDKDQARAENLLLRAINNEYGPALFQKAMQSFDLTNNNNSEEVKLLILAKEVGFKPATYLLAKMYEVGNSVEKDTYESAQLYKNLQFSEYKDSETRLISIKEKAKKSGSLNYDKISQLDDDIEVITITHEDFDFETYLTMSIQRFKSEKSIYDGKGGMSHIRGRVCNYRLGCRGALGPEEVRIFFGRGSTPKSSP
jgi:hypothetical protein